MPYNFTIQYKLRRSNSKANSLSQIPKGASFSLLTTPIIKDFDEFKKMVGANTFLSNIQQAIQQDPASYPGYSLEEGHVHYNGKLVIPSKSPYVPLLLREFHNSVYDAPKVVWHQNSIGRVGKNKCNNLSQLVIHVKGTNTRQHHQQDSFNLSQFRIKYGRISQWIL